MITYSIAALSKTGKLMLKVLLIFNIKILRIVLKYVSRHLYECVPYGQYIALKPIFAHSLD